MGNSVKIIADSKLLSLLESALTGEAWNGERLDPEDTLVVYAHACTLPGQRRSQHGGLARLEQIFVHSVPSHLLILGFLKPEQYGRYAYIAAWADAQGCYCPLPCSRSELSAKLVGVTSTRMLELLQVEARLHLVGDALGSTDIAIPAPPWEAARCLAAIHLLCQGYLVAYAAVHACDGLPVEISECLDRIGPAPDLGWKKGSAWPKVREASWWSSALEACDDALEGAWTVVNSWPAPPIALRDLHARIQAGLRIEDPVAIAHYYVALDKYLYARDRRLA